MQFPDDDNGQLLAEMAAEGINLKFTDSGRLVATLKSAKMLDYTNKSFPYREFPDGVAVEFFDEEGRKNTVDADYGIVYEQTKLIDLQGNVVVITADDFRSAMYPYIDLRLQVSRAPTMPPERRPGSYCW